MGKGQNPARLPLSFYSWLPAKCVRHSTNASRAQLLLSEHGLGNDTAEVIALDCLEADPHL